MKSRHPLLLAALLCLALSACDPVLVVEDEEQELSIAALLNGMERVDEALEVNPSGLAPLTARVSFQTVSPTQVTVTVLGAEPLVHTYDNQTTDHTVPILGLYAGVENEVVIRVTDPARNVFGVDTVRVVTPALPDPMPTVDIVEASSSSIEPGWTLASFSIGNQGIFESVPFVFDTNGDIRWYLDLTELGGTVFLIRELANTNLMVAYGRTVYEYDRLGQAVNQWTYEGYWYHHDVVEKPDGNLLVAVNKSDLDTVEDHVIELDRATGAIVHEWDMRPILDMDRFDLLENEVDWFHMNAIWYDERDDTLILSGRNQGLVKVNRNNELVWILAPHQGWGAAGLNGEGHDTRDFLLTAVDASGTPYPDDVQQGTRAASDFDWVWGQHAPMILPNGNLFVFDNGTNRHFGAAASPWSRGVEYRIDEAAGTVQQVWAYGEARGSAYFSPIISDVDVLPQTGNRLIMPGFIQDGGTSYAHVTEVTYPEAQVVFDARINFTNLNNTGQGWGQVDIVYRAERMHLYPEHASSETSRPSL
ncbi:MAG: aryl-sulfate sulfotransferase [Bacteroidota bacterium]